MGKSPSFVVRATKEKKNPEPPPDPPELGAFLWGMLAGSIVTVVVEGVAIYFAWPFLVEGLKLLVGTEAIREMLR